MIPIKHIHTYVKRIDVARLEFTQSKGPEECCEIWDAEALKGGKGFVFGLNDIDRRGLHCVASWKDLSWR